MKQQKQVEEFDFIKEKIKDKPINKRRLLIRLVYNLLCAVAFGTVACFVFVLLKPYMEEWLYPEKGPSISIPQDVLPQGEETEKKDHNDKTETGDKPDDAGEQSEDGEPKTGDSAEEDNGSQHPEDETEQGDGTQKPEDGQQPEDKNQGTEEGKNEQEDPQIVVQELELEDYQKLQNKLYAIGKKANKSVVTVTGVTSGVDWFSTPYEKENRTAGIIIGNNGEELLILTEKKIILDARKIHITFIDGEEVSASLKKYDGNTGIAVIGVSLADIPKKTMRKVDVAALGNSYMVTQGTAVIAIGSPLGTSYSILCGTITSSQNKVSTIDTNYTIFTTDIVGSENGSGVLINLKGEIIGLLLQDYSSQNDRNTITALSISELKQIIQDLSNSRDIPYVGLYISTVTDEIAQEYGIPKGVYIKSVELDSPAMAAGLQEADVITAINGEEVTSVEQYFQRIYEMKPEDVASITIKRQNVEGYVDLECTVTIGILQ